MRYLLDTHALIWYSEQNGRLPSKLEKMLDSPENWIYISSASLWEITIKSSLGKLDTSLSKLLEGVKESGFQILQIENMFLDELQNLPKIHKDPFDRLLIATAKASKLTLITADENIQKYDIDWIW